MSLRKSRCRSPLNSHRTVPVRWGASSPKILIAIVVVLALAIGGWLLGQSGRGPGQGGDASRQDTGDGLATDDADVDSSLLTLTRAAIASTENLEAVQASDQWRQVLDQRPKDGSAARNLALSRLLVVDELAGVVANPGSESELVGQTRQKLPAAIDAARKAIETFVSLTDDDLLGDWMSARIDLHEADLIPAFAKSIRRDVIAKQSEIVASPRADSPAVMRLGGVLIDTLDKMADPIDGLPREIASRAAGTLGKLSDAHPDNLYFAIRAARLGIDQRSDAASKYVGRTGRLVQAIMPSLARDTRAIGKTPDELVAGISAAIEAGDWDQASGSMALWFNVLNGTELVKTDRRRADPHPLDLLSLTGLRDLSAAIVQRQPVPVADAPLTFQTQPVAEGSFRTVVAVDADLDLQSDLAAIDSDDQLHLWIYRGSSWKTKSPIALGGRFDRLLVADLFIVDSSYRLRADRGGQVSASSASRHNTLLHLVAIGPDGVRLIQLDGRDSAEAAMTIVETPTGLESVTDVVSAIVGDLEADGDLDLVLSTKDGLRLFANRGNRSFFEIEMDDSPMADDPIIAMAIGDLDRDLDLDIVTLHGKSGRVGRLENLLHLQFRCEYFDQIEPVRGASMIAIEDFDGDVAWDLLVSGAEQTRLAMGRTETIGAWDVDEIMDWGSPLAPRTLADFNNDSYFDAIGVSDPTAAAESVSMGAAGFTSTGEVAGLVAPRAGVPMVAAELNGDRATDLAIVTERGIAIAVNQTPATGQAMDIRFKGIDDNVSGRVNHFAIGSVVEARFGPHYRARIITGPSMRFGVDGFDSADIRAILPNGLTQTKRDVAADQTVEEEQTLKGSCPYLYAFDGTEMQFVTDCLWAAPLGLQSSRDAVVPDRPWEYLKIDGSQIRPRRDDSGEYYDFRITEELWEIAYFDQVELVAVDHPADVEIWTNEKVGPDFIARPTTFAFDTPSRIAVQSAVDTQGRDVTETLKHADRDFVQGFDHRLRQGLCPPHHVDLGFATSSGGDDGPELSANDSIYLVMTGWILPTDTSLNIQIDQNPDLPAVEYPSVAVPVSSNSASSDEGPASEGEWKTVIPYMGFPGGKTKTIVVDVTEVANREDLRFRIATSAQIYWDAAELVIQSEPAVFTTQPMPMIGAEVTRHGFSKAISAPRSPDRYDYHDATSDEKWPPLAGPRSALGDCTDLLREWDDEMVVIASGDEIQMRFEPPAQPLRPGWKRDFILHNVGWDKDADLNTLEGQSTLPLPYRGMTVYPPPPNQSDMTRQRFEKNRKHLQRTLPMRSFWKR